METKEASKRYKILQFYEKHGLEATKEAFDISRMICQPYIIQRTIYSKLL